MASNKPLNPPFEWGDPIMIKENAPTRFKPGFIGSVCGIRIEEELYLVEFKEGEAMEIPGDFLTNHNGN